VTRLECRGGVNRAEVSLGGGVSAQLYDGVVLELSLDVLVVWVVLRVRLFYSAAMERRAWDRWQAECLAGEHQGITIGVSNPEAS
jgi:hypothetical protein